MCKLLLYFIMHGEVCPNETFVKQTSFMQTLLTSSGWNDMNPFKLRITITQNMTMLQYFYASNCLFFCAKRWTAVNLFQHKHNTIQTTKLLLQIIKETFGKQINRKFLTWIIAQLNLHSLNCKSQSPNKTRVFDSVLAFKINQNKLFLLLTRTKKAINLL